MILITILIFSCFVRSNGNSEELETVINQIKDNNPLYYNLDLTSFKLLDSKTQNEIFTTLKENIHIGNVKWHNEFENTDDNFRERVEEQLIMNNFNYTRFPSHLIYALLSSHVYSTNIDIKLRDWRINEIFKDETSGFYSVLYENNQTGQMILAFRGTNHKPGWIVDVCETYLNELNVQYESCYNATKTAVNISREKGFELSMTGHEFGAYLAELSLLFSHSILYENVRAITFESPGTKEIFHKIIEANHSEKSLDINSFNIITYLHEPNSINTCNHHLGRVVYINSSIYMENRNSFLQHAKYYANKYELKYIEILIDFINRHSIETIIEEFDPDKSQNISNWPQISKNMLPVQILFFLILMTTRPFISVKKLLFIYASLQLANLFLVELRTYEHSKYALIWFIHVFIIGCNLFQSYNEPNLTLLEKSSIISICFGFITLFCFGIKVHSILNNSINTTFTIYIILIIWTSFIESRVKSITEYFARLFGGFYFFINVTYTLMSVLFKYVGNMKDKIIRFKLYSNIVEIPLLISVTIREWGIWCIGNFISWALVIHIIVLSKIGTSGKFSSILDYNHYYSIDISDLIASTTLLIINYFGKAIFCFICLYFMHRIFSIVVRRPLYQAGIIFVAIFLLFLINPEILKSIKNAAKYADTIGIDYVSIKLENGCGNHTINKFLVELGQRDLSVFDRENFFVKQLEMLKSYYYITKSEFDTKEYKMKIVHVNYNYDDIREILNRLVKVSYPVLIDYFCLNNNERFK